MEGPSKLTERSKAVQCLKYLLKTGAISGEEESSYVHKLEPVFQPYKLDNIRNAYNRLRRKLDLPKKPTTSCEEEDLNLKCTNEEDPTVIKKPRLANCSPDDEVFNMGDVESSGLFDGGCRTFKPFYNISVREEARTMLKRVSVAILLPSGVYSSEYSLRVLLGGECLEMKGQWANCSSNIDVVHRKWLLSKDEDRIQSYHLKLLGFENYLKERGKRNSDPMESVARIPLPVAVENHMYDNFYLSWRESDAKSIYIKLRAQAEEYGMVTETKEFEIS